jgi:hypothetical protein
VIIRRNTVDLQTTPLFHSLGSNGAAPYTPIPFVGQSKLEAAHLHRPSSAARLRRHTDSRDNSRERFSV